ncbi:MAG: response regulator transcription factor [Bacteroidota bacterium]
MKSTDIFLSDHQELTNVGLVNLIRKEKDLSLVGNESDWTSFISTLEQTQPNLIICDYFENESFPTDFLERIKKVSPNSYIIIVTADSSEKQIHGLISRGARGFLTKSCSGEEILSSIRAVTDGNRFFCPTVLDIIVRKPDVEENQESSIANLSQRESEVLKLIAEGYSTQQISEELHVSIHTINSHRKNIYKKLKLKKPRDLILFAMNQGLVSDMN